MLTILVITFPFFALVLCGYAAVRRHLLPQLAIPGLNSFVLYFALPCMLFRFGSTTPIARLLDGAVAGVYLLCALLTVGLTVALTLARATRQPTASHAGAGPGTGTGTGTGAGTGRRPRLIARTDWNNAAFGALVAAFPNTGFMGVPLLLALLGPSSSAPVIQSIAVDMVITSSLCIALSRLGGASGQSSWVALRSGFAGMLRNPMPWSIALGALASAADLVLPAPLMNTVQLLADAASPVALFTIGAVLARSHMNTADAPRAAQYVPLALIKLLVHPLLVWGVGHAALGAGLALNRDALTVLVLVACLPSASNVAMLTERFGADTGRVARIILVSTALSFLTFSAAVTLLTEH